ncbi:hypothetical protein BDM02DRAFT_1857336 [Thelephora ganbajun]|uniref:Uncharacterized protein n=1 Tax=Thelephora ganbajun TaxID=370292 RepID=A0ACB6Z010_THEGA|nr:hypothetical protein BDM02DRAFT_1857336 [Thelephora ganbajun]
MYIHGLPRELSGPRPLRRDVRIISGPFRIRKIRLRRNILPGGGLAGLPPQPALTPRDMDHSHSMGRLADLAYGSAAVAEIMYKSIAVAILRLSLDSKPISRLSRPPYRARIHRRGSSFIFTGKKCLFTNTPTGSIWIPTGKTRLAPPFYDGYIHNIYHSSYGQSPNFRSHFCHGQRQTHP